MSSVQIHFRIQQPLPGYFCISGEFKLIHCRHVFYTLFTNDRSLKICCWGGTVLKGKPCLWLKLREGGKHLHSMIPSQLFLRQCWKWVDLEDVLEFRPRSTCVGKVQESSHVRACRDWLFWVWGSLVYKGSVEVSGKSDVPLGVLSLPYSYYLLLCNTYTVMQPWNKYWW